MGSSEPPPPVSPETSPTTNTPPPPQPPPPPHQQNRHHRSHSRRSKSLSIILAPVPQPQKVPIVSPPYLFRSPDIFVRSPRLLRRFFDFESSSGNNFLGFIVSLSDSIRGHKNSDHCHQSETLTSILSILDTLLSWVDDLPSLQYPTPFFDYTVFSKWRDRLTENAESLMLRFLPDEFRSATVEIVHYFKRSFGTCCGFCISIRHEINFAVWLYCLARLGILKEEDYQAVVSKVSVKYFELMRRLKFEYDLKPVPISLGFWSLDDYHFLPFIFGSSQLISHKYMKPKSIQNQDVVDKFSDEYLFLSSVVFAKKVKNGVLSPMLDDISRVRSWSEVNSGLLKMYRKEVLANRFLMRYVPFGWLFKWEKRD